MATEAEIEALEIELLLTAVQRRWGYDFREYAPASLARRVRRALELEGLSSMSELQARLLRDADTMQRFIATLSVHVTAMFRDPEFYRSFRQRVVPLLRTYPFVRIWHAGCATGEEVYSLAILLQEEGLSERVRIYATDLSEELLAKARDGVFPLRCMRDYTQNYLRSAGKAEFSQYYAADDQSAIMSRELRRSIVFSQHNLVSDGSFNEFHVILCRNVLIYFDDALRERVHQLFIDSLTRFGILALGIKENLRHSTVASHYEALDADVCLYRRVQ